MNTSCFMILVVLAAAALANVASIDTAPIDDTVSSLPEKLGRGVQRFLATYDGIWSAEGRLGGDILPGKMKGMIEAKGKHLHEGMPMPKPLECITKEQCKKSKTICTKKCPKGHDGLETKHFPGKGKCVIKCKKCVPTC